MALFTLGMRKESCVLMCVGKTSTCKVYNVILCVKVAIRGQLTCICPIKHSRRDHRLRILYTHKSRTYNKPSVCVVCARSIVVDSEFVCVSIDLSF